MAIAALSRLRARLGAQAPVPAFALAGTGARGRLENLELTGSVALAQSPRHAMLLLIAGAIPRALEESVCQIHDQLPHPRATFCWGAAAPPALPPAARCAADEDPVPALRTLQRELLQGRIESERSVLPDAPPAPWRGKGEHGQGGDGMMGGTPYGRPLTMTGEDVRDGLALDAHEVRIGPFAPMLAPGLRLRLTLQGDVVQRVDGAEPPLRDRTPAAALELDAPAVPLAVVERLRLAMRLRDVGRFVQPLALSALSRECFRRAAQAEGGTLPTMAALRRLLYLCGGAWAVPAGLGRLPPTVVVQVAGSAARAAGCADDRRCAVPAYRRLGFRPLTQRAGDVRARLWQWLAEAEQSHALAARPAAHAALLERATARGLLEDDAAPEPAPAGSAADRASELLTGLAWDELVMVVRSFDADALRRLLPASRA